MSNIIADLKECQKRSGFSSANYVREKTLSFEYIRYRILRPIIKVRYHFFRKKHSPSPWLSPAATLFFEKWLSNNHNMAEFGSGLSTVFFAKRVKEIVSIEHFDPWYEKVVAFFKDEKITNIDYRLIKENKSITEDNEMLKKVTQYSSDFNVKTSFKDYYSALDDKPVEFFDVILVDGRARPECVFSSLEKLKSGGLMVLDNSERDRYKAIFNLLKDWSSYTTSNGLTDTTFWVKP
jgi:hypothetical protein